MPLVDEVLQRRVIILYGGLCNALEDRGHVSPTTCGPRGCSGTSPLRSSPCTAYFEAGADVATTASYQASVPGLVRAGLSDRAAAGVIRSSVEVARKAAESVAASTGRELLVAASVGPYGAALADGTEYRGRYGVSAATLQRW